MFILAIIGVSLFKGLFFYCDMTNIPSYAQNVVTVYDCYSLGGEWRNQDATYDSMWAALLNLFENFTVKKWILPMYNAMDIVDIDMQPVYYDNPGACVFSIIVIICLFFFIRNIFTGIVADTFSKEKEIIVLGTGLITIQRRWVKLYKQIYKVCPLEQVVTLLLI